MDLVSAAYGDAFDEFQRLREAPIKLVGKSSDGFACRSTRAGSKSVSSLSCSAVARASVLQVANTHPALDETDLLGRGPFHFASTASHGARFLIGDGGIRGLNLTCLDLAERPAERVER